MDKLTLTTDGSYTTNNPDVIGWGCQITGGDNESTNIHGAVPTEGDDKVYHASRNIGGECYAVIMGLRWAYKAGYRDVVVKYDYTGLEQWANKSWKRNKQISQAYEMAIDKARELGMNIEFEQIKGEDNPADALARIATGAPCAH